LERNKRYFAHGNILYTQETTLISRGSDEFVHYCRFNVQEGRPGLSFPYAIHPERMFLKDRHH
jgi:hypothetical protein